MAAGGRKRKPVTVAAAIEEFLASPRCNESSNTHRAYAGTLHHVADHLDPSRELADVNEDEIGEAVTTL
jgi:hypothetical protein